MKSDRKLDRRILIIDDEIEIGETIQAHLEEVYSKVDYFSDPMEAKEALSKETYSLILSDVRMPKLLGPDLIRFVRAQGILAPVIFLTGFANKENILTALRLGVADVIEKPYDPDELLQSIERVLEIEKRRVQMILDRTQGVSTDEKLLKQKKMIGLLQVVNERKKVG